MNGLFRFLASSTGRWVRIVAGAVLVLLALFVVNGALGWVLGIVGLVPLLAGILDKCVFAPLAGLPFNGEDLRHALAQRK